MPYLIAAVEKAGHRVIFIGKDGAWRYDKPVGLSAWPTHDEAAAECLMLALGGSFLSALTSKAPPPSTIPELKWPKVVEFARKVQAPPGTLYAIRSTAADGSVVWFGKDGEPSLDPNVPGWKTRAEATEQQDRLRANDTKGRRFEVKEFVRRKA